MQAEFGKVDDSRADAGNRSLSHRHALAQGAPGLLLVGLPMAAIVAVSTGAGASGIDRSYLVHEILVAAATLLGGLFTLTAYRGFLADHSAFRYYLTLAFLAETLLYAFHGVFTRWADTEPLLFLLYGPASRLAMAALLLMAILALRSNTMVAPERTNLALWAFAFIVVAAAIAAFALLGWQGSLPASLRVVLELAAFMVLAASISVLLHTTYWASTAIARSLTAALILFIMASLSFLLVSAPWDPMFWLAHAIFAAGFLILGVSVVRARRQVSALGEVFDLKSMEIRLRDQESALAHRESLQRISGGIAHHINNLMTVVISDADSLAEASAGRPAERRMAEACLEAGKRAAELSRRLQVGAGDARLMPTLLPLNDLLDAVARVWRGERGQDAGLDVVHSNVAAEVYADQDLLVEAVLALLQNGRDASQGEVALRLIALTGGDLPDPGFVGIAVNDRGSGMTRDVLARAKEPFFSTRNMALSSGLGLSLAEGVATSLGGSLTLESRHGTGTTATIWLPAPRQEPATF